VSMRVLWCWRDCCGVAEVKGPGWWLGGRTEDVGEQAAAAVTEPQPPGQ